MRFPWWFDACCVCLTVQLLAISLAQADVPKSSSRHLRDVTIIAKPIYGDEKTQVFWTSRAVNALHKVTKKNVIRREVWLSEGDPIADKDAAEIERNLRALGLFADVSVELVDVPQEQSKVDLIVRTRDRLSLVFSAGASLLGGIGEVRFTAGERNFLGRGHELLFGYSRNTEGELLGSVSYDNLLLAGSDIYGGVRAGQTEEGDFFGVSVQNRFQHRSDSFSWLVDVSNVETRLDFYANGNSIAEVPRNRSRLKLNLLKQNTSQQKVWQYGLVSTLSRTEYSAAVGTNTEGIEVPDNTDELFGGLFLGFDRTVAFKKVTDFDTLGFTQDIALGQGVDVLVGTNTRKDIDKTETLPELYVNASSTNTIATQNYLNMEIESFARIAGQEVSAWSVFAGATFYNTRFAQQTLAARLRFKTLVDNDGLQERQSLGEDNGLRGYPAREFNGEQSLVLNLEDRFFVANRVLGFELGVVGFFDTGWVGKLNESASAYSSAGVGLRIGSAAILGADVIRIDVAYPFDDGTDRQYNPTLSFALGHVFGFKPERL